MHSDGAKYVIIDGSHDGHFFAAHTHDSSPARIDRIVAAWQHHFAKKPFQFVLDGIGKRHIRCRFLLECMVAGSAEQDALTQVTKIIEAFVKMECAFEWQPVDWGGDEDLAPGGSNIQLGEELAGKGVGADEQLAGNEREGVLTVQQQMAVNFFVAADVDVVED